MLSSGFQAGSGGAGETMISGYTGEAFRTDIFIGPVYYQRLRHMVSDKFQVSPNLPVSCNMYASQGPVSTWCISTPNLSGVKC